MKNTKLQSSSPFQIPIIICTVIMIIIEEVEGLSFSLAFYIPEWDFQIRNFTLHENQMDFVFLPSKFIDWAVQDENSFPVVALYENEPVGIFVLHISEEIKDFTENDDAIFLRAFSINKKHQGKGYGRLAMEQLPQFVLTHFPRTNEIVLTVEEINIPARQLYEKTGFRYLGKSKPERIGIQLGMHYLLVSNGIY